MLDFSRSFRGARQPYKPQKDFVVLTGLEPAWEAMIKGVSRKSARASMEAIRREEMQGEIYTVNITILMEDEIIHDEDHPYCTDWTCPCRKISQYPALERYNDIIERPVDNGLMTNAEARRLYFNENI